jgi:hypothetical protein
LIRSDEGMSWALSNDNLAAFAILSKSVMVASVPGAKVVPSESVIPELTQGGFKMVSGRSN